MESKTSSSKQGGVDGTESRADEPTVDKMHTTTGARARGMHRVSDSDTACGFFERTRGSCYLKYEDQRRTLKTIQVAYNKVKPSTGLLPSGHQWGDLMDALVTKLWVEEEMKKGEARRKRAAKSNRDSPTEDELFAPRRNPDPEGVPVRGTTAPAPQGDNAVDGSSGRAPEGDKAVGGTPDPAEEEDPSGEDEEQREEEAFLDDHPKPDGWLPPYMLSWILFGPLSSSPDEDFSMNMSSGPEGSAKGDAEGKPGPNAGASGLRSPADLQMLVPPAKDASRQVLKKLEREANDLKLRNDRNTRQTLLFEQGEKRMEAMCGHLEVLVSEVAREVNSNTDDRKSKQLAELEKLYRDDGQDGLANKVRRQRIKLLAGPDDDDAAIAGGGKPLQMGGACSNPSRSTRSRDGGRGRRGDGGRTSPGGHRSQSPEVLLPPATSEDLTLPEDLTLSPDDYSSTGRNVGGSLDARVDTMSCGVGSLRGPRTGRATSARESLEELDKLDARVSKASSPDPLGTRVQGGQHEARRGSDSGGRVWDRNESPASYVGSIDPRRASPSAGQDSGRHAAGQYGHAGEDPAAVLNRLPGFSGQGIAAPVAVQGGPYGYGRRFGGVGQVPTRRDAFLFQGQACYADRTASMAPSRSISHAVGSAAFSRSDISGVGGIGDSNFGEGAKGGGGSSGCELGTNGGGQRSKRGLAPGGQALDAGERGLEARNGRGGEKRLCGGSENDEN